jgi:hypothetical protein
MDAFRFVAAGLSGGAVQPGSLLLRTVVFVCLLALPLLLAARNSVQVV